MRNLILSSILVLCIVSMHAQNVNITLGEGQNYKDRDRSETSAFLIDGKRYVLFKYFEAPGFQYQIFIYGANNKLLHSGQFTYPMGVFGNAFYINNFIAFNNKLWFLKDHLDKPGKTSTLIAQQVKADGTPDSKETVLATHVYEKMVNTGGYKEAVSPNGELLAVLTDVPWVKDQAPAVTITVFDKDLNKKWSKDYTLNEPMDKGPNYDLAVADNGAVYFVKNRVINNAPLMLKVMAITEPSGALATYDIKLPPQHKIRDYQMVVDADNTLVMSGCYTDEKSIVIGESKTHGTWFTRVNGKAEPEVKSAAYEKPIELLKSTHLLLNGGVYFLTAEQQKVTNSTMSGSGPQGILEVYEYDYNNGQVTGYGADGGVRFNTAINKANKTKNNDFYNGIFYFVSNGKLMALYADDALNYEPKGGGGRIPVLAGIANNGQADNPVPVTDAGTGRNYHNMLYLGSSIKTGNNELFTTGAIYGSNQIQAGVIRW